MCTGSVTQDLAWLAQDAGAQISTKTPVEEVLVDQGVVKGVRLVGGEEVGAKVVLANADPFSLLDLLPHGALPDEFRQNTLDKQMDGLTMKVRTNFAVICRLQVHILQSVHASSCGHAPKRKSPVCAGVSTLCSGVCMTFGTQCLVSA